MILLITYGLFGHPRDASEIEAIIKTAPTWWHHLDNVWMVKTDEHPRQWYEKLKPALKPLDHVLIIQVEDFFFGQLPHSAWDWLNSDKNWDRTG